MDLFRKVMGWIKWPLLVLLGLNLENLATFLGLDNLMVGFLPTPEWLEFLFTPKATYIYLLGLAFLSGFLLDGFLRKFINKKAEKTADFGKRVKSLGAKLEMLHNNHLASPAKYSVIKHSAEVDVIELKLNKMGIKTLDLEPFLILHPEKPFLEYLRNTASLFYSTGEYLANNEVELAQENSKRLKGVIHEAVDVLEAKRIEADSLKAIEQESSAEFTTR